MGGCQPVRIVRRDDCDCLCVWLKAKGKVNCFPEAYMVCDTGHTPPGLAFELLTADCRKNDRDTGEQCLAVLLRKQERRRTSRDDEIQLHTHKSTTESLCFAVLVVFSLQAVWAFHIGFIECDVRLNISTHGRLEQFQELAALPIFAKKKQYPLLIPLLRNNRTRKSYTEK